VHRLQPGDSTLTKSRAVSLAFLRAGWFARTLPVFALVYAPVAGGCFAEVSAATDDSEHIRIRFGESFVGTKFIFHKADLLR
jgi:hypothetical protein